MKSLLVIVAICVVIQGCSSSRIAPQTTQEEREKFRRELIQTTIEEALTQPLTKSNEVKWQGAFWGMELARYTSDNTTRALRQAFRQFHDQSPEFQRSLLEVVYALHPHDFMEETENILRATHDEKIFAMAALHNIRGSNWSTLGSIIAQMKQTFPQFASHPILRMLNYQLQEPHLDQRPFIPPVADLLSAPIESGKPVIFSLQRKDRTFPGVAVIRNAQGKFIRDETGKYFAITQLALAASNLPGYITNGNTPQGIFSVQGLDRSKNKFIGPTETVHLVLPIEAKPFAFFHNNLTRDSLWTRDRYAALLPPSWRTYLPIYAAYYAGEAGRWDITAHGTTIDPSFYENEPCYPISPSQGCLTSSELWSQQTGENIRSDQQRLIDEMKKINFDKGYFVVVEIDDERRAVSMEDVAELLHQAEQMPYSEFDPRFRRDEQ